MARFPDTTTETTSDEPVEDDETSSSSDPEGEPGLLARLSERARQIADLVSPFSNLLTAVVQAATVYTLVRNA